MHMAWPHSTPHYKESGFWFTKIHQVGMEILNLLFSRRTCTHFQYIFTFVPFFPTKRTCPWHGHTIHPITKNVAFGSLKSTKWAWSCGIYKFLRLGMHQFSTHLDPFHNMCRHITQPNMGQHSQYMLKHCTTN
jgi:hypothetical protein